MQVGGGELTLFHDEINTSYETATKKTYHPHSTFVPLQKLTPESQKEVCIFILNPNPSPLTRFLTKEFSLSFIISYN